MTMIAEPAGNAGIETRSAAARLRTAMAAVRLSFVLVRCPQELDD